MRFSRILSTAVLIGLVALGMGVVGAFEGFSAPETPAEALESARRDLGAKRYAAAETLLERLEKEADKPELLAEIRVLLARARIIQGKAKEAFDGLDQALVSMPASSPWTNQARYLLAEAGLDGADAPKGAEILRERAAESLTRESRRRLADRFEKVARELLNPARKDDPLRENDKPDHRRALVFLREALIVRRDDPQQSPLVLLQARSQFALGQHDAVIKSAAELRKILGDKMYLEPLGAEATLLEIQSSLARKKYRGIREKIAALAASPFAKEEAYAHLDYLLGLSYGLPGIVNAPAAESGLAAWRSFVTAHPAHPRAEEVRRETVTVYRALGEIEKAEEAARTYIDFHADHKNAPAMAAEIVKLRELRGDYAGARRAIEDFLRQFPNDSRGPLLRPETARLYLVQAQRLQKEKRDREAEVVWGQFLEKYPAHKQAALAGLTLARLAKKGKRLDDARKRYRETSQRYRKTDIGRAAQSLLELAELEESAGTDLAEVVAILRSVTRTFPRTGPGQIAQQKLNAYEAVELQLEGETSLSADYEAEIGVAFRNVKGATLRLHPINLETWFRRRGEVSGFETLDVDLVKPHRNWEVKPKFDRPYLKQVTKIKLADKTGKMEPGLYILTAEDGMRRAERTVLVSDLQVTVKHARRQILCFVQNRATGKPQANARIMVADGKRVVAEGKTGPDGVYLGELDLEPEKRRVVALHDGHGAFCAPAKAAKAETFEWQDVVWFDTDRPIYRPGQPVTVFGFVRRGGDSGYELPQSKDRVRLTWRDPQGIILGQRNLALSGQGSFSVTLETSTEANVGDHQLRVEFRNANATGRFELRPFQSAELDVEVRLDGTESGNQIPGESVKLEVRTSDFLGHAAKNVRLEWEVWRESFRFDPKPLEAFSWLEADRVSKRQGRSRQHQRGAAVTDAEGVAKFDVSTILGSTDTRYIVRVRAFPENGEPQDSVMSFVTALAPYYAVLRAGRQAYRPGDRLEAELVTVDSNYGGLSRSGVLRVTARRRGAERFEEIERRSLATGIGGRVSASIVIPEAEAMRLIFEGKDESGRSVRCEKIIEVRPEAYASQTDLRLTGEKLVWKEGETAGFILDVPISHRPVLVCYEGERIFGYRIVTPKSTSTRLELPLESWCAPNLWVAASMIHAGALRSSREEVVVSRWLDLQLETSPKKPRPGDSVTVDVVAKDQKGRPVAAEFFLSVVDEAVLARGDDLSSGIRKAFYGRRRPHGIREIASAAWKTKSRSELLDADLIAERTLRERSKSREEEPEEDSIMLDFAMESERAAPKPRSNAAIGLGGGAGGAFGGRRGGKARKRMSETKLGMAPLKSMQPNTRQYMGEDQDAFPGAAAEGVYFARDTMAVDKLEAASSAVLNRWKDAGSSRAVVRRRFLDLAFFRAAVSTDREGKARIEFKLPDNLTSWQVRAVGTTEESKVGEGRTSVLASKSLTVELVGPRRLLDGDKTRIGARTTSWGSGALKASLAFALEGGAVALAVKDAIRLELQEGEAELSWRELRARAVGGSRLRANLESTESAGDDAVETSIDVDGFGKPMKSGGSVKIDGGRKIEFEIPRQIVEGTGRLRLAVSTGADAELFDAFASLMTLRKGRAFSREIHRTWAALAILNAMDQGRKELPFARIEIVDAVRRGLRRLVASRHQPLLCSRERRAPELALVLECLEAGDALGLLEVREALTLARAEAKSRLKNPRSLDVENHAALVHALSLGPGRDLSHLEGLLTRADRLSATGLARGVLAAARLEQTGMSGRFLRRLEGRLLRRGDEVIARGHAEIQWCRSSVSASAWALRAVLATRGLNDDAHGLLNYLRSCRLGPTFGIRSETAAAAAALADWVAFEGRRARDGVVQIDLNGEAAARLELSAKDEGSQVHTVPFGKLKTGANSLEVKSKAQDGLRITWTLDYMEPADSIAAESRGVSVHRRVINWRRPEDRRRTVEPGFDVVIPESRPEAVLAEGLDRVLEGSYYEVVYELRSELRRGYLELTDRLPAGLVPAPESLRDTPGLRFEAGQLIIPIASLKRGVTRLSLSVFAMWPGTYRTLPASVSLVSEAGIGGHSASGTLSVVPAVLGLGDVAARAPTPDERYGSMRSAYREEQWDEVAAQAKELLTMDLRADVKTQVLDWQLVALLRLNRSKEALASLENLMDHAGRRPNLSTADRQRLGGAFMGARQFRLAAAQFRSVLGDHFETTRRWRRALMDIGRREQANVETFEACLSHPASNATRQEWLNTAYSLFDSPHPARKGAVMTIPARANRWEEGLRALDRYLALHPEASDAAEVAYQRLGWIKRLGMVTALQRDGKVFEERKLRDRRGEDVYFWRLQAAFAGKDYSDVKTLEKGLAERSWGRKDRPTPSRHAARAAWYRGKVAEIEGRLEEALTFYRRATAAVPDARDAIAFFEEETLHLPTLIRRPVGDVGVDLSLKNIDEATLSLYAVDLPLVFATRKSLRNISRVNLTGIEPDAKKSLKLPPSPYRERKANVSLGKRGEGAWLMVAEGGGQVKTGLLIVSGLEIEVHHHEGRMRIRVRDAKTGAVVPNAQIRIGNGSSILAQGRTDRRGTASFPVKRSPGLTVLAAEAGRYALKEL